MATAHPTRRHVTPSPPPPPLQGRSTLVFFSSSSSSRQDQTRPAEAEAQAQEVAEAMAGGGWMLDLSLATAGTSAPAGEQRTTGWRAQRRTVSSLFAELGTMLPNLPTDRPASQEEIVEAAAAQVKVLEEAAAVLETYRAVRRGAGPRPEVAVAVATVCFSARLPAPAPGALTRVLEVFHRRGVEVLMATVARHGHGAGVGDAVVTVTAAAAPPEVLEMIRADIARIY